MRPAWRPSWAPVSGLGLRAIPRYALAVEAFRPRRHRSTGGDSLQRTAFRPNWGLRVLLNIAQWKRAYGNVVVRRACGGAGGGLPRAARPELVQSGLTGMLCPLTTARHGRGRRGSEQLKTLRLAAAGGSSTAPGGVRGRRIEPG